MVDDFAPRLLLQNAAMKNKLAHTEAIKKENQEMKARISTTGSTLA